MSPTGWTAITPRIVTGRMVNRTMRTSCAFASRTESFSTNIVPVHIATSAKVFIISDTEGYFRFKFCLVLTDVD